MFQVERDLADAVYNWAIEYREARPDEYPFRFAVVSRRWARSAMRFGRPLLKILEDDGRFVSMIVRGGGRGLSLRSGGKPFSFED